MGLENENARAKQTDRQTDKTVSHEFDGTNANQR